MDHQIQNQNQNQFNNQNQSQNTSSSEKGEGYGNGNGHGSAPIPGGSGSSSRSAQAFVNPYLGHRALTPVEQELLGEYARLAATIKRITSLSRPLSSSTTHSSLLSQLRILERKMGLVLTLFKASVWAIVVQQQDEAEEARLAQEAMEINGGYDGGDYNRYSEGYSNHDGNGNGYDGDDTLNPNGNYNGNRNSNTGGYY